MRDFPVFTTQTGVSSLVLREIPYRGDAYIHIRDIQPEGFEDHLQECVSFCRMAGARRVYATGHPNLAKFPCPSGILEMHGTAWINPEMVACLFPVTEETVFKWRGIYNEKLENVDHASTLDSRDEAEILRSNGAYFIHRDGVLLGIGYLQDNKLLGVASCQKGSGEILMHSLMSLIEGENMCLEVASTNHRAITLYEKLGFLPTRQLVAWHLIFPNG